MKKFIFGLLISGLLFVLNSASATYTSTAEAILSPQVSSISPTVGYNDQPVLLTILGANFSPDAIVWLDDLILEDVNFLDSTTLNATVPALLPGDRYSVTVENPDGSRDTISEAYLNVRLGEWYEATKMQIPRWYHASTTANNILYVLGGTGTGGVRGDVEMATINPDRTLSDWRFTTPMNINRLLFAAVTNGKYIYAIGGMGNSGAVLDTVEVTNINPGGELGEWQQTTPLPQPRCLHAAVIIGDFIYVLGGHLYDASPNYITKTVLKARINSDGTLSEWSYLPEMNEARSQFSGISIGNKVFAIGGKDPDSIMMSSVEFATVSNEGDLGPWNLTTPLPEPLISAAVASNGARLTLIGGMNEYNVYLNTVVIGLVNDDGSNINWIYGSSLPETLYSASAISDVSMIYVTGGYMGGALVTNKVLVWNMETSDSIEYGVSINSGALFTNNTNVELTIGAPLYTKEMKVSNDGGFAGAVWEPFVELKKWTITQYGNYIIPRVVYIRFKDQKGQISSAFQDDIILDVTAPQGNVLAEPMGHFQQNTYPERNTSANLDHSVFIPLTMQQFCSPPTGSPNVSLTMQAQDDVSGVGYMMISGSANFSCSVWEAFSSTKQWYAPPGTESVYVKFQDYAGNVSEIYTDPID